MCVPLWLAGLHSHLLSANKINPDWVALDTSRGIETPSSKVFMRATSLISDILIYIPSLYFFIRTWLGSRSSRAQQTALLTLLLQPALILIDSGHFQYNSVMLGFTVLALNLFFLGHDLLGAICFVLSLGFKQMALYYSPPIFAYLLGKCLLLGPIRGYVGRQSVKIVLNFFRTTLFTQLGAVTLVTIALLFLPWLYPPSALLDPIIRIFPFARGLFEDKVANFWCASNVIIKWRSFLPPPALPKLATAATAAGFLPSIVALINPGLKAFRSGAYLEAHRTPTLSLLPYALFQTSMSFFLFSFQVHEKSILLPLLPLTLLAAASSPGRSDVWEWGILMNNIACFSMWPLLKRDGLGVQYIALVVFWNYLVGYNPLAITSLPLKTLSLVRFIGGY